MASAQDVRFDQRDGLSRLSFHIWNTEQDADRVAACLDNVPHRH
jgi:hypothetical protein